MLFLIPLGILIVWRTLTQSPPSKEQTLNVALANLGDVQLQFPNGNVVDVGTVPKGTQPHFLLSFVNSGKTEVDLGRFQICETCFKGAKLLKSDAKVAPGQEGVLEFEVTTGERAGQQAYNVEVEYAAPGPQRESSKIPRFTVQLSYLNDSPGTCHWEHATLDFGDVTTDDAPTKRVNFIQQLRRDLVPNLQLRLEDVNDVSAVVVAEKDAPSVFNLPGTAYEVEIRLQRRAGQIGPGRETILAETPLGDQRLEVKWNSVNDYVLRPANGILFTSPDKSLTQIVSVKSIRSNASRISSAVCDIPNVEVVVNSPLSDAISQGVSLRIPARCSTSSGKLTVRLLEQSGDEHEEVLQCKIVGLASEPMTAITE